MSDSSRLQRSITTGVTPALFLLSSFLATVSAWSETPLNPALVASPWPASWIASAKAEGKTPGVFYFREEFSLISVPAHFWVHVSADNRFVLHVNGNYSSEGPARGDLFHWRFETVDLAPLLHPGRNVLAATVWNSANWLPSRR